MSYLLITTLISDTESLCFDPIPTVARHNHVRGYLKEIQDRFNREKGLEGDNQITLSIRRADEPSGPLFPEGKLQDLGEAAMTMLRRQYRERYDEVQNV